MKNARYSADGEDDLRVVELDGLTLLFHCPSGMTHIVAPPAPQILEALRHGPADIGELMARLRAWYDLEIEDDSGALEARIDELEAAGLVSRL